MSVNLGSSSSSEHTVFDSMVRSNDIFTPHVVAEKGHPHQYTVSAKKEAPYMHVDFIEHPSFYAFHAGKDMGCEDICV